jgi:thioredoxin-related protein
MRRFILFTFILLAATATRTEAQQSSAFPPLEQFRQAVLAGDSHALEALFSKSPSPQITDANSHPVSLQSELEFWSSWKSKGLTKLSAQVGDETDPRPDLHIIVFRLTLMTVTGSEEKRQFVNVAQGWLHQGDQWSIGFARHSAISLLRQPLEYKLLYHADVDPNQQIATAIATATSSHKRILLVFGGNWCFDCHVLDEAFHSPEIAPTLEKSFVVLHINIGQMDENLDVAKKYDIPLDRGVPAIAVLDSDGKLLFSQKRGEFEAARSMAPEDILAFLNKWKPA